MQAGSTCSSPPSVPSACFMFPRHSLFLATLPLPPANITASEGLFRLGIVGSLVTQLVQVFVVLALYKVLAPVGRNHALLMVIFVLLAVPIAMLNELNHVAVLGLVTGGDSSLAAAGLPLFLNLHEHGIMIAHLFWGLWLFPMGYLVFRSGYLPKLIGVLLMIGCFGYLVDSATFFLLSDFGVTVSEFTFVGELLLPLWLVFRGVNVEGWERAGACSCPNIGCAKASNASKKGNQMLQAHNDIGSAANLHIQALRDEAERAHAVAFIHQEPKHPTFRLRLKPDKPTVRSEGMKGESRKRRETFMTSEGSSKLILLVSLGFAAAAVFLSYLFPNTDSLQTATLVLITLWPIPFACLVNIKREFVTKPLDKPLSEDEKEQS